MKYTRAELGAIIDARRRAGARETLGDGAWMEFRIRVTPELLHQMLGARIVQEDGTEAILDGVWVTDDGYVEPLLTRLQAQVLGDGGRNKAPLEP